MVFVWDWKWQLWAGAWILLVFAFAHGRCYLGTPMTVIFDAVFMSSQLWKFQMSLYLILWLKKSQCEVWQCSLVSFGAGSRGICRLDIFSHLSLNIKWYRSRIEPFRETFLKIHQIFIWFDCLNGYIYSKNIFTPTLIWLGTMRWGVHSSLWRS